MWAGKTSTFVAFFEKLEGHLTKKFHPFASYKQEACKFAVVSCERVVAKTSVLRERSSFQWKDCVIRHCLEKWLCTIQLMKERVRKVKENFKGKNYDCCVCWKTRVCYEKIYLFTILKWVQFEINSYPSDSSYVHFTTYSLHYAEACNEFGSTTLRHWAWIAQLFLKKCCSGGEPFVKLILIWPAQNLNLGPLAPKTNGLLLTNINLLNVLMLVANLHLALVVTSKTENSRKQKNIFF